MTKQEAVQLLLDTAREQLNYKEGPNNYNKFAEDQRITKLYGWNVQNQPWCCVFVNWVFINTFDYATGIALTYGGSAACRFSAALFKNNGAFVSTPEPGDQIFYYAGGDINHTGLVEEVTESTVITLEGNYSDGVSRVTHSLNDPAIAGYGRPNWELIAEELELITEPVDLSKIKRSYYKLSLGDGVNNPLPQVKAWQNLLLCWGISVGTAGADGEFGDDTLAATKKWQRKAKSLGADIEINGIVDRDDWEEIIHVAIN